MGRLARCGASVEKWKLGPQSADGLSAMALEVRYGGCGAGLGCFAAAWDGSAAKARDWDGVAAARGLSHGGY